MSTQNEIPESCWKCKYAVHCDSSYGEGSCRYRLAIEIADRKGADSDGS